MKRLTAALVIIGMIIAVGIFAIVYISAGNDRIYGRIEEVLTSSEEAVIQAVERLSSEATSYARSMGLLADDKLLRRLTGLVGELRIFTDDSREVARICHEIEDVCNELMDNELPKLGRIL